MLAPCCRSRFSASRIHVHVHVGVSWHSFSAQAPSAHQVVTDCCKVNNRALSSASLNESLACHPSLRRISRAYDPIANTTKRVSSSAAPSIKLRGTCSDGGAAEDDDVAKNASKDASYLVERYEQMCREGGSALDEHQMRALTELDRLRFQMIRRYGGNRSADNFAQSVAGEGGDPAAAGNGINEDQGSGFFNKMFSSVSGFGRCDGNTNNNKRTLASPPRGVYIHGGVGCGKTFCMDLFYNSIAGEGIDKRSKLQIGVQKVHFHAFMLNLHKQMHTAKMVEGVQGDVLPHVIEKILDGGSVICFDELQVTDVADALILRRLFTGLIDRGAIIVATSNRPPRDLYLNGLQRDRFLPFIDLLEEKTSVVSMWESEIDYRLIQGDSAAKGVYFVGKASRADFDGVFHLLTKGEKVGPTSLSTQGRRVQVPLASLEVGCAKFDFNDLCKKALGAADYICIGENFHTVFVDNVPQLTLNDVNVLRRLITFIDCMYEAHVKLILQLETQPKDIFEVDLNNAHQDEAFSFDRTRSRLVEMGSKEYLKKRWIGRSKEIDIGQTEDMKHELEFLVEEDDGIKSEEGHKKGRHLYRHAKAEKYK